MLFLKFSTDRAAIWYSNESKRYTCKKKLASPFAASAAPTMSFFALKYHIFEVKQCIVVNQAMEVEWIVHFYGTCTLYMPEGYFLHRVAMHANTGKHCSFYLIQRKKHACLGCNRMKDWVFCCFKCIICMSSLLETDVAAWIRCFLFHYCFFSQKSHNFFFFF